MNMSYQITDIHGVTRLRPEHSQMVKIVDELYHAHRDDFLEATLTHSSGVAISIYQNGSAVMDTADSEDYSILENLSKDDQLMLWIQTAGGNLSMLQKLDWKRQGDKP